MEKGGRKKYITERNRRSFREQQGIVAFCTCQWDEWMNECVYVRYLFQPQVQHITLNFPDIFHYPSVYALLNSIFCCGQDTIQLKCPLWNSFSHSHKRDVHLMGQCPICPLNIKFLLTTNSWNYCCHNFSEITPLVDEAVLYFPEKKLHYSPWSMLPKLCVSYRPKVQTLFLPQTFSVGVSYPESTVFTMSIQQFYD